MRTEKRNSLAEHFLETVKSGHVNGYLILANTGDCWRVWKDTLDNFVHASGAILQLLFHASGLEFQHKDHEGS